MDQILNSINNGAIFKAISQSPRKLSKEEFVFIKPKLTFLLSNVITVVSDWLFRATTFYNRFQKRL